MDTVGKFNRLLSLTCSVGLGVLDRIGTMDELSVSLHTLVTKQLSEQCAKKEKKGSVKAKVHASQTKSLALDFFDYQGIIYTNHAPKETMVNARYIRMLLYRLVD
jgi:hypothetical protein